jgi:AraC-like DNA-binding protein
MTGLRSGQFFLLDMNQEHASLASGNIDCISVLFSRGTLKRFHEEHDLPVARELRAASGKAFDDHVIRNLGECLLPAFDTPEMASQLFVDHVALALLSHLVTFYGDREVRIRPVRGALAPYQERRAKEMLLEHINGGIGLQELASACGLSRSHFARAFKATTGESPLQWLLGQRIERAKILLLNSDLPIEQITQQCGFADQSHLTRAFTKAVGASPSRWRRDHL